MMPKPPKVPKVPKVPKQKKQKKECNAGKPLSDAFINEHKVNLDKLKFVVSWKQTPEGYWVKAYTISI